MMKKADFEKWNASIRKNVGREYGFRQSSYINYIVLSGYFFCLSPTHFNRVRMGHRTKRFFQWSGKMGERF